MKKILYLSLCAVLIIGSLTACAEESNMAPQIEINEAYDLYKKMLEVMAEAKSIDMEISALNDVFTDNGESSSGYSNGNIKKADNGETGGTDIEFNFSLATDGVSISSIGYYTNGILYSETAGIKQSHKQSDEKLLPFISHADLLEFPESAVKAFTVNDDNGDKKVEMTLDGNSVTSIIEKNQSAEDYNLSDVACEFIVGKDNMLKYHRIIYEENMALVIEDVSRMKIKKDVSITVNSYNDVTIEPPSDLDEYEYIDMDF